MGSTYWKTPFIEISRTGSSRETECGLPRARADGDGRGEMVRGFFLEGGNILKLTVAMVAQLCERIKTPFHCAL